MDTKMSGGRKPQAYLMVKSAQQADIIDKNAVLFSMDVTRNIPYRGAHSIYVDTESGKEFTVTEVIPIYEGDPAPKSNFRDAVELGVVPADRLKFVSKPGF